MKRSLSRALSATLCAALAVSGVPAAAQGQAPSDLTDLLGARGRDGEFQMESRGYNLHHSAQSANSVYGYWWNTGSKKCVRVRTEDGRYQQIDTVGSPDCGQQNAQGMSDGAKIAIGAAALLGIAALAHKSHHRDDQSYDERQTADFERGFRDGKYNHHFSNYSNSQEYAKGYAGVLKNVTINQAIARNTATTSVQAIDLETGLNAQQRAAHAGFLTGRLSDLAQMGGTT